MDDLAESGKKVKYNCLDSSYSFMPVTIESDDYMALRNCLFISFQALLYYFWSDTIPLFICSRYMHVSSA